MAVRITHTNNSDGHDGTFVYRSTGSMDPQDLPDPIVDSPPVALGAVFEYIDIDHFTGVQCYRTQDHEGGQLGTLSAEVCVTVPENLAVASVGDEVAGGLYAGTIEYADGREFHIIVSKADGQPGGLIAWGDQGTAVTGSDDSDDGAANTQDLIDKGIADHPAAEHCVNYTDSDGNDDYYMPAINELIGPVRALHDHDGSTFASDFYWSSTESSGSLEADRAVDVNLDTLSIRDSPKGNSVQVRPIRRVPV